MPNSIREIAIKKKSLKDIIFEFLKSQILSGTLKMGQILTEKDIATRLNVSRTPVREAFNSLYHEGLILYRPEGGVVVNFSDSKDMIEIYYIMIALEGIAARLAAEQISKEDLQRMQRYLALMETTPSQSAKFKKLHKNFNAIIFKSTKNSKLIDLINKYIEYIDRVQAVSWEGREDTLLQEHKKIFEAIKNHDPDTAESAMRLHVENSRNSYIKKVGIK